MTSSVHKSLSKAEKHLKSGNLAAAEVIYQQILAKFPKNAKAIQGVSTAEVRHKPSNLIQ
ncbi:hypothetical protein N9413_06805 [Paracoccaceae bacterium]|jgi:hypothetical protein|nr:hypothetical protein [Paracoccaceae bacterium]